jgi:hypothetical protein
MVQMPKQVSSSDRIARTVRAAPDLIDRVDEVAHRKRTPFNEVANAFFEDGIRLAGLDEDVRAILIEAGEIATRIISARMGEPLQGNARLMNAMRVLREAVAEAGARRFTPNTPMICMELWAGAKEVVEERGLKGEPWDLITSIRSTSPPLSEHEMERVQAGVDAVAAKANEHELDRLRALAAYVAHAQHQHLEDWDDVEKQARADLDDALGIWKERGSR